MTDKKKTSAIREKQNSKKDNRVNWFEIRTIVIAICGFGNEKSIHSFVAISVREEI